MKSTSEDDSEHDNYTSNSDSSLDEAEYSDSLNAENSFTYSLNSDRSLILEESLICDADEWAPITGKASNTLLMNSEKKLITLNGSCKDNKVMPINVYHAIVAEDIMNLIFIETNRYRKNNNAKFRETNKLEMRKFGGLVNYMGNVRLPIISLYWSQNPLYNLPLLRRIMPRDRILSLHRNFHASDNDSAERGRLIQIQPLLDELNKFFKMCMNRESILAIDESMVPWRGRLVFRQYMPGKRHKYGIKLFKLCTPEDYTANILICSGKES